MNRENTRLVNELVEDSGRGPAAHLATVDMVAVHDQSYAGLLPLLQRLDERLAAAVEAAEHVFAARAAGDLYRGLAISPADVVAALGRVPGAPFLSLSIQSRDIAEATNSLSLRRLLWLQRVYGLTDFVGHDPQVSISAIGSPLVRQIFATAAATRRAAKHRET